MSFTFTLQLPNFLGARRLGQIGAASENGGIYQNKPLVSVIIPACNEENRIGETLENLMRIKKTEYSNLEIIVAVNGSSDGTEVVARRYTDRVLILGDGNSGQARNEGARLARGEVLIFLDADNQVGPSVIAQIAHHISPDSIGTCSFYPSVVYLKSFVARKIKNLIHALGLVRGANGLVFCHADLFKARGIYFDPKIRLGEFHDFIYRARKQTGAKYTYIKIRGGCRVSVDRYERVGYFRSFLFWVRFTLIVHLLGARNVLKRATDPTPFENEYWGNFEP